MEFTEKSLVEFTIKQTKAVEDFPFNGPNSHEKIVWHIIRHPKNKKIISMIFVKDNVLTINLKLTADHVEHAITIPGVNHGYHMNKKYWVSVDVNNNELSQEELKNMIMESFLLTV
ncbi:MULTISPECIES: MmcQ/YjbR family DNA-binding protein [Leuconostoc]|uniref:MmcQ/YjbR family DNA-binding protein n=1 Tax=Leuconostoc TaxID=1243 RepID=UPI0032DF0800